MYLFVLQCVTGERVGDRPFFRQLHPGDRIVIGGNMQYKNRRRVSAEDVFFGFVIASPAIFAALLAFMAIVALGRVANDPFIWAIVSVGVVAFFAPTTWSWYNRIDGKLPLDFGEQALRIAVMGVLMGAVNQTVWNHTESLDLPWRVGLSAFVIVLMLGAALSIFPDKQMGWRDTTRFALFGWFVATVLLSYAYVMAVLDVTWDVAWWQVILRVFLLAAMVVVWLFSVMFMLATQPEGMGSELDHRYAYAAGGSAAYRS